MRTNLPVTQREYEFTPEEMLVSITNLKGEITHCNPAFVRTSGFTYEELIGQPHNLIRHPDMPPEAFKDLWQTIGRGKPWSALVKNRRKNGDHYWVLANVTPILENGKPVGYMSVRTKPDRAAVQGAETLYARMGRERSEGRVRVRLQAGRVETTGLRGRIEALSRLSVLQRVGVAMVTTASLSLLPLTFGLSTGLTAAAQALMAALTASAALVWLRSTVSAPLEQSVQFANTIAAGDLTRHWDLSRSDELGALSRALNQLNVNLRAIVSDVRSEAEGVERGAGEIAAGNVDLSARTDTQASSLEETSASLEELTSTVKQTADAAHLVRHESTQAQTVAEDAGEVVARIIQTMQGIHGSSRKMQEIIQVIEGIAFQTNILALNAAVEAARAGEQGRGFAVVASEVRALAHRSSEAAREIRGLIGSSVKEVTEGAALVESAGGTMSEVVSSVQKVSNLIQEISTAASEQSAGIGQINEAVAQLDAVTQQNAALVEQSTAAAEQLTRQAGTLTRAVEVFRIR